ncbi:MAG: hypothetical protein VKJ64_07395 [Leptolyngbyaceae bacterium]|nr:hypothetical protein [Leptolyngbyaceae bacterium]
MYTPADIQQQFDAATLAYLQNKTRGGDSGQKGTRYEDYFAVYKLTQLAQAILETGLTAAFRSQILAFVDDLIIDIDAEPLQHYQLKNSPTVSWNAGDRPIQADFDKQQQLNQAQLNRESDLSLVVSDANCAKRLQNTMPGAIAPFSRVQYFPKPSPLLAWLEQVPEWKQAIVYLSAFDNPEPDKMEYVVKALMGAWITCKTASALELLTIAQQQSPQYIRSFQTDLTLDVEVKTILGNIPDFRYSFSKGFLHWDYADGLISGTPPYSADTDAFRRLQERIKERKPTTFEELENLL